MITNPSDAPSTNAAFDKVYNTPFHWVWTDVRIPKELKEMVSVHKPQTSLELGCGLGRFSRFMAGQKIQATGVDFSAVAIGKAIKRVSGDEYKPTYMVGDVTNLEMLAKPFDVSFDIGCFHCLNEEAQLNYVSEVYRLLKPGATHLIWALDESPSNMKLTPDYIARVFGDDFQLQKAQSSRRRIIASHWYWLVRKKEGALR